MVDLLTRLGAFLNRAAAQRHDWGRSDSMLLIADWMLAATGRDPAAPWRGRYSSPLGAARIIRRAGGKAALLDDGFARVGCALSVPPKDARCGDVGLVPARTTAGRIEPVGAIRSGSCWVVRTPRGLLAGPAEAIAAWRPTETEGAKRG